MKYIIFFLFFFITINELFSQEIIEENYYKKYYNKSVTSNPSKAKFKATKYKNEDGSITTEWVRLKDSFLLSRKTYKSDKPVGQWFSYYENGKIMSHLDYDKKLIYSNDKPNDYPYIELYSGKLLSSDTENYQAPQLDGFPKGFTDYLIKNLRVPEIAIRNGLSGKVLVLISIDEKGKSEVISIYKGTNRYLDLEAERLLIDLPDWTPCLINGKKTKVYSIVPISFAQMRF